MLIRFSPHGDMPSRTRKTAHKSIGPIGVPRHKLARGTKTVAVVAMIQSRIWKPKLNSFDQNSIAGMIYGSQMVKE
jgi:hypothetical protein